MITLTQVKAAQPSWFSRKNKKFFGDRTYRTLQATSGQTYLVRSTYAWTDMFGKPKQLHYRLNPVNAETHKIESLIDDVFPNINAVKKWLKEN